MGNELVPFKNEGQEIRAVVIKNVPWFVAKDVCDRLGLGNVSMTLRGLDDDEKDFSTIETPGGPQSMAIVNEPGLYSLILRSRKPDARAFKRWVTHEVLPSLREHGTYSVESVKPEALVLAQYQEAAYGRRNRMLMQRGLYENRQTGQVALLPSEGPQEVPVEGLTPEQAAELARLAEALKAQRRE